MKCFQTVVKKPLPSNVLLVMKLTALLTLFFTLNVAANGFGQEKINLRVKKTEIGGVLQSIEKQTNYRFLYNNNLKEIREKVSLNVNNASLKEVLSLLLFKTKLLYQVMDNNLIIIKEDPAGAAIPDVVVRGKITGEGGAPVIGASVQVKGTTTGTTTNTDGNFTLTVPDANVTLVISSVGYDEQEVALGGRTDISVSLTTSARVIDQVVVIGYGTANKRDLTGSIVTVKAKEIADRPASNPLSLLQGKVPGLSIVNSGRVGAEPDVRIRGTNTVNGLKPVYIVDGILNDNINFLNPADIESIEILKDPSSLAIFGVRGANGAIAITTKKAKAGQLLVNFNTSFGIKRVQDRMKLTNAAQFKELYTEQLANQSNPAFDFTLWNGNTDWQDQIFQNAALNYNNISITGATEKNRFYLGVGYISEEGLIKHEEYKKMTLNFSDELRVGKALKFGITMNAYRAELPVNKDVGSAIRAAPIAPVYDPNGSGLLHTLPTFQRAQVFNPLVSVETEKFTSIGREYRAVGSIYGEVDFLKHFNFRAQLFADYGFNTTRTYSPIIYVYNPEIVGTDKRDTSQRATAVSQSQNVYPKTQMDYLLTYKNKFGDHDLSLLAGVTTTYNSFEGTSSSVQQGTALVIPNDPTKWYVDQVGDLSTRQGSGSAWEDASLSYLARALYSYKGKYLLNASFRRDGSSQFYYLDNEWKNFGAIGAGWIVSQEDFFDKVDFINFLKVKGSWGVLGNKNIGETWRYPAFPTLVANNSGVFGDRVIAALQPEYLPAKDLNWETVRSWEVGVELRAFRNRLSFEANYYNKRTKDILTIVAGPSGTIPGLDNLGEVTNRGFEFSASWTQNLGKDLSLSVSGNLTTIKNEVVKLNQTGYAIGDAVRTTAGYPISYFYGYISDGIYQTATEIQKSPPNLLGSVKPGDIKFRDVNKDGVISDEDRTMIGNPTPDFIYGGTITLNYKGFDFGVDVQGSYGNEILREWNKGTFAVFNYLEDRMDRWHGIGTSNWEPVVNSARPTNYLNSTYWVEDGSFFRVRNIQLGYTFSPNFLNRSGIKSLRVYINAQNIGTFANNSGYTPELGGSATSFGVDNGTYPVPAIYSAGLNLNF